MRKAESIAATGVLAALYCVTAFIVIPFPAMPLTLQCFAIALGAYTFGCRATLSAVAVYVAIGAAGLPIFAGMQGGVQVLTGPTGGFVWGFFLLSLCCGADCKGRFGALGLLGLCLCYTVGIIQHAFITGISLWSSFLTAGAPFFLKDTVLIMLARPLSKKIKNELKKSKIHR